MRFIGNKEKLLASIERAVSEVGHSGGSFFDFFSGTTTVGRHFRNLGYRVFSSDILFFSYVLQRAYIQGAEDGAFAKLSASIQSQHRALFETEIDAVVGYLNDLPGVEGFVYKNYTEEGTRNLGVPRKYFTPENGKRIDAVRQQIEKWKQEEKISEDEYYMLLAAIIESVPFYANISGVYAAFLKKYDPRALKRFQIRPAILPRKGIPGQSFFGDSMKVLADIDVDVLYLDPPYNARQYAPNYHLLETIARYDNPTIRGVAGMRDYSDQKSEFCNARSAVAALDRIASKARFKTLILSYNSEGIMTESDILATLQKYGEVSLKNIEYPRYKSNNNGEAAHRRVVHEQLYVLRKDRVC